MSYSTTCECGAIHAVAATQAGTTLECKCGRAVCVPALSALRQAAGETPIPLNTIERIEAMIRDGELPSGNVCPVSGRPADRVVHLRVECEQSWVRGGDPMDSGAGFAFMLLFGWIGLMLASRASRPREELGRDTAVTVPLGVASEARSKVMRMRRQKALKALLRSTPIYAELLDQFPDAHVHVLGRA